MPSRATNLAAGVVVIALCAGGLVAMERVLALLSGAPAGLGFRALGLLWSLDVLVLTALGVAGGVLAPLRTRPWRYGAALAALSLFATIPVGSHVSAGPWISAQSWAWAVPWAVGGAGAVGMVLFGRLCAPDIRPGLSLVLLALAVASAAADHFILPGQHTSFHLLLHALAAMFMLTAANALPWERLPKGVAWSVVALSVAGLLMSLITISPATRAELVHLSATGDRMLGVGGPPAPESFVRYELEHLGETTGLDSRPAPEAGGAADTSGGRSSLERAVGDNRHAPIRRPQAEQRHRALVRQTRRHTVSRWAG